MPTTSIWCFATVIYCLGYADGYITGIAVRLPLEGTPAARGAPWPLPQVWENSTVVHTINPHDFQFLSSHSHYDVITEAFSRYKDILINTDPLAVIDSELDMISGIMVTIEDNSYTDGDYPTLGSDESYTLIIHGIDNVDLTAQTVWGALRGLETFSQLLYSTNENYFRINDTMIEDYPRFAHRGFMIDTSRHFMPMSLLLDQLDAMAYNKYNVLHWHAVDDQAFPYPSRTFPNLTAHGAYTKALYYTRDDVDTILEVARLRGIRVIPEFDTPGHTYSWGLALPDLITPCWGEGLEGGPYVANYPEHGEREVINPMEEYTYDVLDQLYQEIAEDFPDAYVHLGMDEAYYACWESNPNISDWMIQQGFTSYSEVEEYFCERLIAIAKKHNMKYIIWEDPITHNNVTIDDDTLVEIWKDVRNDPVNMRPWQENALQVARQGYQMLLSAPWYLNVIEYGQDWRDFYMVEPTNFTDNADLQDMMVGGEVCAWMEYMDGTNFLSRVWPRASAAGEVLWSRKGVEDIEDAQYRLDQQRCRMVRRSIPAQPLMNGFCGDYEWGLPRDESDSSSSGVTTTPSILLATAVVLLLTYVLH